MGQRIQGRDRKGQARRVDSSKPETVYSVARGPPASMNEGGRDGGREQVKGCWV